MGLKGVDGSWVQCRAATYPLRTRLFQQSENCGFQMVIFGFIPDFRIVLGGEGWERTIG